MSDLFYIIADPKGKEETDGDYLLCETRSEADAEEIGAALALAGYNVTVKTWPGVLIHEFFAS